jgi:hypothetical protein
LGGETFSDGCIKVDLTKAMGRFGPDFFNRMKFRRPGCVMLHRNTIDVGYNS